jgi:hypothetical protein
MKTSGEGQDRERGEPEKHGDEEVRETVCRAESDASMVFARGVAYMD